MYSLESGARLDMNQGMYVKWLEMGAATRPDLRSTIVRQLHSVCSARSRQYLTAGDARGARLALKPVLEWECDVRTRAKWLLTCVVPSRLLAKLLVRVKLLMGHRTSLMRAHRTR